MATWVHVNKAAKFPEVVKVYQRAGGGMNGGPANGAKGFLNYVRKLVQAGAGSLPSWIRLDPNASNDWQNCQVDVTAIPGVRALRDDGKWTGFVA